MKNFLFAAIFALTAQSFAAETQLVYFDNYTGPGEYSEEYVSTLSAPLPSAYLTDDSLAVCFRGDNVEEVPMIVSAMAAQDENVTLEGYAIEADETSIGNPMVVKQLVLGVNKWNGKWTYTYPLVRPCSRTSK